MRLFKNHPLSISITGGMAYIGASLSIEPNISTNTCQGIPQLVITHVPISIGIRGIDYTRTTYHTTLGMAICTATRYLKQTSVLQKFKR